MSENLTILCPEGPQSAGENVGKIAGHMGVPFSFSKTAGTGRVMVAHWRDLQTAAAGLPSWLREEDKALFVYGWMEDAASNQFLAKLTAGAVLRARTLEPSVRQIFVAPGSQDFSRQLAGLDFEVRGGPAGVGFVLAAGAKEVRRLIHRDQEPVLVELKAGGNLLVLSGVADVANLDSPVGRDYSLLEEFESLAPLMMFLRRQFGARCWHAGTTRGCLLIDDPLLRPNYGHVNYQKLLQTAERHNCSVSIAFIPWNYRRTHPSVAALFNSHPDRLSICVHGCDHTRGEFASLQEQKLRQAARRALWRMEQHQRLSGVKFDPVMVFPQGLFSTAAMTVLAQSRFLAAINTSPVPTDGAAGALTLQDVLEPAVTRFGNFPLLIRHYPNQLAEFALDLFLGKPLLVAEHHGYFRRGYQEMEGFMVKLNGLDPSIHWTSPGVICSRLSVERVPAGGGLEARFFTDRFFPGNASDQPKSCILYHRALSPESIRAVKVNGQPSPWDWEGSYLRCAVTLAPGQQAEVVVEKARDNENAPVLKSRLADKTRVFFRRHLSEIRDNYVDKSALLGQTVHLARRLAGRRRSAKTRAAS